MRVRSREREKKHALRNAHRGGVEGRARIGGASAVYNLLTSHNTQKTIFKREKTYNAGTRFVCFTLFVIVEEKREREKIKSASSSSMSSSSSSSFWCLFSLFFFLFFVTVI